MGRKEALTNCKIEGCNNKTKIVKGFCNFHYLRFLKGRDLYAPPKASTFYRGKKCLVENCENTPKSLGLCAFHYKRKLFGRDLNTPRRGSFLPKKCSVEGCNNDRLSKGLCNAHYIRSRKEKIKDISAPIAPRRQKCSIEGCPNKHSGRGFCSRHYDRYIREQRWTKLIEIKGGVCQKCKNSYHFSSYDFHHRDPKQKEYTISALLINHDFDTLLKEVEKCDLLCANCHRLVHYELFDDTKKKVYKKKENL